MGVEEGPGADSPRPTGCVGRRGASPPPLWRVGLAERRCAARHRARTTADAEPHLVGVSTLPPGGLRLAICEVRRRRRAPARVGVGVGQLALQHAS